MRSKIDRFIYFQCNRNPLPPAQVFCQTSEANLVRRHLFPAKRQVLFQVKSLVKAQGRAYSAGLPDR